MRVTLTVTPRGGFDEATLAAVHHRRSDILVFIHLYLLRGASGGYGCSVSQLNDAEIRPRGGLRAGQACHTSVRTLSERGDFFAIRGERLHLSKVMAWIVVILLIIWIFSDPSRAGHDARVWATNLGSFFTQITGCVPAPGQSCK